MTLFNQISESFFAELLARRFTTPGGSSSPALAPEIFPVFVVESGDNPENLRTKGVDLCGARTANVAAAAGLRSAVIFNNPAASRMIAVFTAITCVPASGSCEIIVRNFVSAGATAVTALGVRDIRAGLPARVGVVEVSTDNAGGVPAIGAQNRVVGRLITNAGFTSSAPIVLRPGTSMWIGADADNVALNVGSFSWYERPGQPGELG